jgi:MFS family permease
MGPDVLRYVTPGYRRRMRRLFVLVAAVILVDTMFYAAIAPLLPEYADDLGLSKSEAGVLSASYAAGTLLAALPSGWLAARLGVRPTMLIGLVLMSGASLAFAFADSVALLDAARFAQGVGGACAWAGGLTWLLISVPRQRRGQLIGAALAAAIGGILLGPVLGGLATVVGATPVFVAVAVVAAGLAVWAFSTPGAPRSPVPGLGVIARAMVRRPVLLAFWLVALPSLFSGAFNVLVPLRLDELGASGIGIGAFFLTMAAIEGVLSPMVGRVSDRRGRLAPLRVGMVVATLATALLAVPESVAALALVVVLFIGAMALIFTPAMALLSDESERAGLDLAFATGLVNLSWAGGQVVGGSTLSRLAEQTSDAVAYALVAVLFAATAALLLTRPRRQARGRPTAARRTERLGPCSGRRSP